MKIGIHCNQFDGRGSGKVPFDYGLYLQEILNHEVIFVTSKQSQNDGIDKINKKFKSVLYDLPPIHTQPPNLLKETKNILEKIVDNEKLDFLHLIKSGENDFITPDNCKTGVQSVFRMDQPHGNVYAGVSEYLAKKFNQINFLPHIITYKSPTENYRVKYNISNNVLVVGRHGGIGQFNIPFVRQAVEDILKHRSDIFFLFLSTEPFIKHERVLFIPWAEDEQCIFNFIDACDVMLHGRSDGETFGLSVAEFSISNKPVMTWSGLLNGLSYELYNKAHIDILKDRVILYNNYNELIDTLFSIDKQFIQQYNWDKYSTDFSPINVMNTYKNLFLTT